MSRFGRLQRVTRGVRRRLADVRQRRIAPADMQADLIEHEHGVTALFDAPGIEPGALDVRFLDGRIVAAAERERLTYEGYRRTLSNRPLAFEGAIELPTDDVDPEAGRATMRADGTLAITVPKVQGQGTSGKATDRIESPTSD